jgi:hypothetical protein
MNGEVKPTYYISKKTIEKVLLTTATALVASSENISLELINVFLSNLSLVSFVAIHVFVAKSTRSHTRVVAASSTQKSRRPG